MKLGIIGAMDIEVARICERMEITDTFSEAGIRFTQGTLEGLDVVVARCGVGKVSAAACAQLLVSRFAVTHLVNTGIAGAISPKLEIGDVVIADYCAYFDANVHHYAYEPGQIPGMPAVFMCDPNLIIELGASLVCVDFDGADYNGPIVTGDSFICTDEERERILERFHPLCCDMEGAAIGQVAHMNGIPFAVLRTISDKADGTTSEDIDERAANLAADIICEFVSGLA